MWNRENLKRNRTEVPRAHALDVVFVNKVPSPEFAWQISASGKLMHQCDRYNIPMLNQCQSSMIETSKFVESKNGLKNIWGKSEGVQ